MKYTKENPRPCLWCEIKIRSEANLLEFGPKLVNLSKRFRMALIETVAIQCRNCGLITPSARTNDIAWRYWNDGGHK